MAYTKFHKNWPLTTRVTRWSTLKTLNRVFSISQKWDFWLFHYCPQYTRLSKSVNRRLGLSKFSGRRRSYTCKLRSAAACHVRATSVSFLPPPENPPVLSYGIHFLDLCAAFEVTLSTLSLILLLVLILIAC